MMSSLICSICLDTLEIKKPMSTTCGHIFCSDCLTSHFDQTPPILCPICRRPQAVDQAVRLFPVYGHEWNDGKNPPTPQSDISPTPRKSARVVNPSHPDASLLRISLDSATFPWTRVGIVPTTDKDGSPLFLGVAAFEDGMHPCKNQPNSYPTSLVSYDGREYMHRGEAYILPFDPTRMEWVHMAHRRFPLGRRPVEGGYERGGLKKLHHSLAVVEGFKIPGKTGAHIDGANVPFEGRELHIYDYEIL
ncbi:hypothetical protein BD311DRAFT_3330 [Dichomitus squalens]|uniref:RING-type domain-containing protein n=1 Tax=Dichomitus squalens TaxID=114155 RepID=A0A4Q9N5X9_9APHY|nr:hypothetical protein BD311DRAFT_3330 [Dichomitus squalens]